MRTYTNKQNLPAPLVQAVINSDQAYSKGDSRWSATQLIDPPQLVHLVERHEDEIVVDVADEIWKLIGKIGHQIVETAGADDAFTEERLFTTVQVPDGEQYKISGQSDLYDRGVYDWKFTSVFTRIFGSRIPEYTAQLNIYRWLWHIHGFQDIENLYACEVYRDWKIGESKRRSDYPPQSQLISLDLWPIEQTHTYVHTRVNGLHLTKDLPDDQLPECTEEEMWAQPTKYAVMRKGRKTSISNQDTREGAEKVMAMEAAKPKAKPGLYIEVRPGGRRRCEDYCPVSFCCSQYIEFQNA